MIAILVVYLLFRIFKWILAKRVRIIGVFLLLVCLAAGVTINKLFFVKMKFIQSQVYPDLYLIKNPDKDKDIVRQAIKEFILQQKHSQLVPENGASKKIQFYEYTTGDWGENGTAYFLEHKE